MRGGLSEFIFEEMYLPLSLPKKTKNKSQKKKNNTKLLAILF